MKYIEIGNAYQLTEDLAVKTNVAGHYYLDKRFHLTNYGFFIIHAPFTWDGATRARDTKSILEASCIHDAFCNLINEGALPVTLQPLVDKGLVDAMERYWDDKKHSKKFFTRNFAKAISPFTWIRRKLVFRAVRIYQANKIEGITPKIHEV